MMKEQHGQYKYKKKNDVLIIHAAGPWNYEAASGFSDSTKMHVKKWFPEKKWAMVAVLSGQGLYTPESVLLLKDLHIWRVENGLRHIAIVHSLNFAQTHKITEHQFDQIYSFETDKKCQIKYFYETSGAKLWLKDLGYLER